jgi:hypothetical protein
LRGHGESRTVSAEDFWANPVNKNPRVIKRAAKEQDTIDWKSFSLGYYPYLVNDIAAAKAFLDSRNDAGECNSRNVILIGAKTGATLGALWMKTERYRFRVSGRMGLLVEHEKQPESRDLIAAYWLSISPMLGAQTFTARQLFNLPPGQKKVPMAFLYGQKEPRVEQFCKAAKMVLLNGKKNDRIGIRKIPDSGKLSGRELLENKLETEELILSKLKDITDEGLESYDTREFKKEAYGWQLGPRTYIPAKENGDKNLVFIPVDLLKQRP